MRRMVRWMGSNGGGRGGGRRVGRVSRGLRWRPGNERPLRHTHGTRRSGSPWPLMPCRCYRSHLCIDRENINDCYIQYGLTVSCRRYIIAHTSVQVYIRRHAYMLCNSFHKLSVFSYYSAHVIHMPTLIHGG